MKLKDLKFVFILMYLAIKLYWYWIKAVAACILELGRQNDTYGNSKGS